MPQQDYLAPLILSLTPAEKKYFIQLTSLRSEDKSYIRLYHAVLQNGEYNAGKLSKELKKTKENLAHEKEYLTANILKALRNFHDKTPLVSLNNLLSDILILKEKGLYTFAAQRLKKTRNLASSLNRFDVQWWLNAEEKFLASKHVSTLNLYRLLEQNIRSSNSNIEWMKTNTAFLELAHSIQKPYSTKVYAKSDKDRQEIIKKLNHPLFKTKFREPLFVFYQNYLACYVYQQLYKEKKALAHMGKAFALIEKHPLKFRCDTQLYAECVVSYAAMLFLNLKFARLLSFLEKLKMRYYRKLPFNQHYLDQRFDAYSFYYMFLYFQTLEPETETTDERIKTTLHEFERVYPTMKNQFPDIHWLAAMAYLSNLYFFYLKDYNSALAWVNRIITETSPKLAVETQAVIRMTQVIIHAQQKNYSILPGLVQSTIRYLKKNKEYGIVERVTLSFINKLPAVKTDKERKIAFSNLCNQYDELIKNNDDAVESMRRFNYDIWARSNA